MHSQIEEAIVIYYIIDKVLKTLKHKNDIRAIKFYMDLLKKKISLSRFIGRLKRLDKTENTFIAGGRFYDRYLSNSSM